MEVFEKVNWIAIAAGGVSSVLLALVWYSPALFYKTWTREGGITEEQFKSINMPLNAIGTVLIGVCGAFVLATLIPPGTGALHGLSYGVRAGLFLVAGFTGNNYMWSGRSLSMFLIDGGYQTIQCGIYGALIGWLQ